jgi:hypothetical protein
VNRTGFRCGRLLRVRTNEAQMSGPRVSGSQTCKPSFADTKTEHHIHDRSALPLAKLYSARRLRSASNARNNVVPAGNVLHVDAFAAVPLNLVPWHELQ